LHRAGNLSDADPMVQLGPCGEWPRDIDSVSGVKEIKRSLRRVDHLEVANLTFIREGIKDSSGSISSTGLGADRLIRLDMNATKPLRCGRYMSRNSITAFSRPDEEHLRSIGVHVEAKRRKHSQIRRTVVPEGCPLEPQAGIPQPKPMNDLFILPEGMLDEVEGSACGQVCDSFTQVLSINCIEAVRTYLESNIFTFTGGEFHLSLFLAHTNRRRERIYSKVDIPSLGGLKMIPDLPDDIKGVYLNQVFTGS